MSNATLKQAGKIISVFEGISTEKMQAILASGLLTDLRDGDISRINRRKFRRDLALDPESPKFLRLISSGETLVIDKCDGSHIIADAQDIFMHIGREFKNWDAWDTDEKETPVQVYEMERDGTFFELFSSLSSDLQKICLTQNQILNFVKKYRDWLRANEYGTFFLFQSKGQFLIARVSFNFFDNFFGGLEVDVEWFGCSFVWYAVHCHRVVVPQLA